MLAFLRRHAAALPWPFFALAAIAFYSIPLFSRNATIHWDLADVTYPAQKFFAESLHAWKLPHWTPYLNSGIPFLADPRTGAWYPLHWPFFVIGITPRTMFWELALHAFLAATGAYLLARRLFDTKLKARGPAIVGAVLYGFGGYFAAHSSALPAFEAAALLPWMLWGALTALEQGSTRWVSFTSLIGGLIVLAGDAPAALESLLALICVAVATRQVKRGAMLIVSVAVLAAMLGGIQIAPAIELHRQSHPAAGGARFQFVSLATLVAADYYNLVSGLYTGPEDPRQYYFYGGLLLLPLAISGFARRERWPLLLAMLAPTVIFDLARRPPGDAWFPAALGLAMAAASGAIWIETRMERPHVWAALLVLSAIDLWFWNLYRNPLVFAHAKFTDIYGQPAADPGKRTLSRTWAPYPPLGLGPADEPLITHTEVTYGAGLAELDRYTAYLAAVEKNPSLLNGLGASDLLFGRGRRVDNPGSLGRVSVPPRFVFVAARSASITALATLDPAKSAIVEGPERPVKQGVDSVQITAYTGDAYRIKYSASSDSLLRIAVPYYPGWAATVDGMPADVVPVDEALVGVFVPPGEHELTLQFQSPRFLLGVSLSAAGALALVIGLILA
jgi:hypothetical protein